MAGRRPKPTALHHLQGTYNPTDHRDRKFEAKASGELKRAPDDLTETQRAAWDYAIKHAPLGVLFEIDREVLRMWVHTLDRRNEAQQILEAQDNSIVWINSPCHRVIDRTTTLLIRLAGELGFSPAARPRIKLIPEPEAEDENNPWAQLRLIPGGRQPSE
jgi:phage terminase small subunit